MIDLVKHQQPGERAAVRRYKQVLAQVTAAAAAMREDDRKRAAVLARELTDLEDAMGRAEVRAAQTAFAVQLHWESALDMLWPESWMKLRLRPQPDLDADPADLAALDDAVERSTNSLAEAVNRRWYKLTRR